MKAQKEGQERFSCEWSARVLSLSLEARALSPLRSHGRLEDNRDGKADDKQIRDHVARSHSDELSLPLSTFGSRVRNYLPIVIERLAFGKSRNDNCNECHDEKPPNEL